MAISKIIRQIPFQHFLLLLLIFFFSFPTLIQDCLASVTTIEVWHYWGDRAGLQAWKELVVGFEKSHPNIHVKTLNVPWNNDQKLLTAIAAGIPPDITMVDRPHTSKWAIRGALMPLESFITQSSFDSTQFFPVTWQEVNYLNRIWAIPFNTDDRGLFYNRTMFREAGLDPDKPPRTWKELEQYAAKLTIYDKQGRLIHAGFAPVWGTSLLYQYAWQKGGDVMNPDASRVTFNSKEWVDSLTWIVSFVDKYKLQSLLIFSSGFGVYAQDPFISGKVAMLEHGCWFLQALEKYAPDMDYGVAPIPIPENGKPACLAAGFALAIPQGSKHPKEAWEFIKYSTSPPAQLSIAKIVKCIPANRIAATDDYFMKDPHWSVFVKIMEHGRHHPISPVVDLTFNEIVRATDLAVHHEYTPKQALDNAAHTVQKALDKINTNLQYPLVNWCLVWLIVGIISPISAIVISIRIIKWIRNNRLQRRDALEGFLMVSPWLIGLVFFTVGPILVSIVYSFCHYQILTPARWVAFTNYKELLTDDSLFWKSLWNTVYYTIFSVPLGIASSLGLALLLNAKLKGIRFFRTMFYTPAVVSGVAVAVLWMWLFNPDVGLINSMLTHLKIKGPLWLASKEWAKPALILMSLWGCGGGMIIYLAGLQGIPQQFYEAAEIDGAGRWRRFIYITIPMLTPTIFFTLILGIIGSFQVFTQAYIMTGGGPVDSTLFYVLYLFRQAFEYFNMGYASAMAWFLFVLVFILTIIQLILAKKWVYYEGATQK